MIAIMTCSPRKRGEPACRFAQLKKVRRQVQRRCSSEEIVEMLLQAEEETPDFSQPGS